MEVVEFFEWSKTPATVVHVFSVVFGMGGALVSDVLFSFFSKDKKMSKGELATLSVLSNLVFYSLFLIIISGTFIMFSDLDKYLNSSKFLAKMSILLVLLLNGYILNRYVWPHLLGKGFFKNKKEKRVRRLAFACGAVSVVSWLSVCMLGVLDSLKFNYPFIISCYLIIISFGIICALFVEKKELN
jgi:hypothetical protein